MSIIDFASAYIEMIKAGEIVDGTAVKEIIADSGKKIGNGTQFEVITGNGAGTSAYSMTTEVSGGVATTTGIGLLSVDVGLAGAAIAPALGIAAGVGLYSLAPEFWTSVSDALLGAGKTIGGKVIAYFNGSNIGFDKETIEIFKNTLLDFNMFEHQDGSATNDKYESPEVAQYFNYPWSYHPPITWAYSASITRVYHNTSMNTFEISEYKISPNNNFKCVYLHDPDVSGYHRLFVISDKMEYPVINFHGTTYHMDGTVDYTDRSEIMTFIKLAANDQYNKWGIDLYYGIQTEFDYPQNIYPYDSIESTPVLEIFGTSLYSFTFASIASDLFGFLFLGAKIDPNGNVQTNAKLPDRNPFPAQYPEWFPWEYPGTVPSPGTLPVIYPLKYPEIDPNPYPDQSQSQRPEPENVPDLYPKVMPDFDIPTPGTISPPLPEVDPDPVVDPKPIPADPTPITPFDPINPNPTPGTPPSPIVPVVPSTVSSNKLFTVYNPEPSELDALGGFLWDMNLIDQLRRIWQDPLDGVISLSQVYATPSTGSPHNIILGCLDSGVSAKVVTQQFVTVPCGEVSINESKKNCTDYSPYTSLHLYLPFIGIVELDVNEFMNGKIKVDYHVDVYTGTCLAEVKGKRSIDMPSDTIIYTFSGNCSQQIPLTSVNSSGLISALVNVVSAGIEISAGGGLGVISGASKIGHSLTHEMLHVAHSGNLSANAGIMGSKKPFVIIGRRHGYDANNYNSLYGFPANKTVYLNNHTGQYIRVKSMKLKTSATDPEREEIIRLLSDGVFI